MSRLAKDLTLAALSALLTSFTFKMRDWTGIRQSAQWPIAAAVLLMIVWMIVERKEGVRTCTLLSSLIGIGMGLFVAALLHHLQRGTAPWSSLLFLVPVIACGGLYVRARRMEFQSAEELERFKERFEEIKAMPPDQAREAIWAEMRKGAEAMEKAGPRFYRLGSVLIGLAMLAQLPLLFWGNTKQTPVMIVIEGSIFLLGLAWFANLVLLKISQRKNSGGS